MRRQQFCAPLANYSRRWRARSLQKQHGKDRKLTLNAFWGAAEFGIRMRRTEFYAQFQHTLTFAYFQHTLTSAYFQHTLTSANYSSRWRARSLQSNTAKIEN